MWNHNRWKQSGESAEWEGEGEREQQINGVRDGVLDRNGNGVGWKWLLVKRDTWVFLANQINRTNWLSIILGGSQILLFHWCLNIRSYDDDMFHQCTFEDFDENLPIFTKNCNMLYNFTAVNLGNFTVTGKK